MLFSKMFLLILTPEANVGFTSTLETETVKKEHATAMLLSIGCQKYLRTFLSFLSFLDQ